MPSQSMSGRVPKSVRPAICTSKRQEVRDDLTAVSMLTHTCLRKGVHSPTLSGTTQLDSYRPLFFPVVLVGDSRLGGISSTISSYESLRLRGYIVDALVLFRDAYYRNHEYLKSYFGTRGVPVLSVDPPPARLDNEEDDIKSMENYYAKLMLEDPQSEILHAVQHLDDCHARRIEELDSMPRRTLDTIWWPFVQHASIKSDKDVTVIDSAWADFFSVYDARSGSAQTTDSSLLTPHFDGSASWWTQTFGHAHPSLALAAASAAGRYGHVMFPEAIHAPALRLAERLIKEGPGKGWASRVFFSDDGSTGMEVALKMALRSFSVHAGGALPAATLKNLDVIGLKGSYHGDTIGAMDATEEGVYTCEWHQAKGFWFEPPTVSIKRGTIIVSVPSVIEDSVPYINHFNGLGAVYDLNSRLDTALAAVYRAHIVKVLQTRIQKDKQRLAALVLEPIVMGAGGMIFVDPLFQRILVDVVRDRSLFPNPLPVVYDEVFAGLYRLGFESCIPILGANPDIAVYAKTLSGGTLPLAATLATEGVFEAFSSQSKADALLHGHSYTAHAVGCEVANMSLDMMRDVIQTEPWKTAETKWTKGGHESKFRVWSLWDPSFVEAVSRLSVVEEVMTLGTVFAMRLGKDDCGMTLLSIPKYTCAERPAGYVSHTAREMLRNMNNMCERDRPLSSAPGGAPFGIHFRTLGNVAYFMTSLNTSRKAIQEVEDRIWLTLCRHGL